MPKRQAVSPRTLNRLRPRGRVEALRAEPRDSLYADSLREPADVDKALGEILRARPDGLFVEPSPLTSTYMTEIIKFSAKNRLPTMDARKEYPERGGLMSYGIDYADHVRAGILRRDPDPRVRHRTLLRSGQPSSTCAARGEAALRAGRARPHVASDQWERARRRRVKRVARPKLRREQQPPPKLSGAVYEFCRGHGRPRCRLDPLRSVAVVSPRGRDRPMAVGTALVAVVRESR
jgi:hypothetical protein